MKSLKLLIILLLTSSVVFSQIKIPKSYNQYERTIRKQVKKIEKSSDTLIWLDPITVPFPESYNKIMGNKNWGLDFLHIGKYNEKIKNWENKANVIAYSFDTAGELDNDAFDGIQIQGYDFTGEGLKDGHGHGTHVAGTIVSNLSNVSVGYALAEFGYLKISPVKILHNAGYGKMNEIVNAYREINKKAKIDIANGKKVIYGNSWGGGYNVDKTLDGLLKEAEEMGVIIVFASGNNGGNKIGAPSNSVHVESIGAIGNNGIRANFSQYGEGLSNVAPGVAIYSTYTNNTFATMSGTSMADPHQVGIYAILLSCFPNSSSEEIKAHVKKYSTDLGKEGYDIEYGYGVSIIDALLDNDPDNEEAEPPLPPIDTIIKENRWVTMSFDDLTIVWGIGNFLDQRPLDIDVTVMVKTTNLAEFTHDEFKAFLIKFFTNRGIMFNDITSDVWDAIKWTTIFTEMFAENEGFKISVLEIKGTDKKERAFVRDVSGINWNRNKAVWAQTPLHYLTK